MTNKRVRDRRTEGSGKGGGAGGKRLENKMAEIEGGERIWGDGGGARRQAIAGEARRLSPREPLSAATCCDGSPFALMRGHLREARRRISTAASALPNSAVKKALPPLTLVCRVAQRGHTCLHVHCAVTVRVSQSCYAMYRVLKGSRSGGGA